VTLLLFQLLFWLMKDYRAATAGALLFGVHPAHIESVAWISAAPDLLAALALLATFLVYTRHVESLTMWRSLAAHGLYAAALLSRSPRYSSRPSLFSTKLRAATLLLRCNLRNGLGGRFGERVSSS
jgi:hypothetical protein